MVATVGLALEHDDRGKGGRLVGRARARDAAAYDQDVRRARSAHDL